MEERVVESREAFPSTTISIPKSIEAEMADGTWMARNQLLKPVQVSQTDWTTAQNRGTTITDLLYPNVLGDQESLVLRTLRMYAFYRISPVFRVQINATVFHQGQLICSFDPFDACSIAPFNFSIFYATGLPNVKIMASFSDAIELKIPFIHPRSYLTTNSAEAYNTLGRFRITILNPLRAAEGASTTLSVTTWLYGVDAQVHVPIQDHNPILNLPVTESEFEVTSLTSDFLDQGGKILTQGKNLISKSTDIVGNIVTGNIGQALRKGQGLIDDLGNIFGFDYPSRTIQVSKTITPLENMAVSKGVSQSQRLALDPFSMHSIYDEIASETKEAMNLKKLLMSPMLLTQFEFKSSDARGTVLKTINVNPCVSPIVATPNTIQRSYLSYISNGFVYWTGGIVYNIEIIATKFHSGKLIFAYIPNVSEAPSYLSASDSLPNIVVDIQQSSSIKFTVPYTSSTSIKNTFILDSAENFIDSCTGVLACYVQNTLAFASNVSPSIEINVYVSAAPDFNLFIPQRPCFDHDIPELEATSVILDTNKNQTSYDTGPVLSLYQNFSQSRLMFGEDYTLLDLIKRFSPSNPIAILPQTSFMIDVSPSRYRSYLKYWSNIYSCWCGSIRYKILARSNRTSLNTLNVTHIPNEVGTSLTPMSTWDNSLWGYAMVRTHLAQDCGVEIEAPYYSKYNMLIHSDFPNIPNSSDLQKNGVLALTSSTNDASSTSVSADLFIAAGDDFRFIYPRPPPQDQSKILSITSI